jgi:hypothetical protein
VESPEAGSLKISGFMLRVRKFETTLYDLAGQGHLATEDFLGWEAGQRGAGFCWSRSIAEET